MHWRRSLSRCTRRWRSKIKVSPIDNSVIQELKIQIQLLGQEHGKLQRHIKDNLRDKRLDKIVKE
jgi:hypothetical protein